MSFIMAIDAGNHESGVVLMDNNYKPAFFSKMNNDELITMLRITKASPIVFEQVACYGMAVGR